MLRYIAHLRKSGQATIVQLDYFYQVKKSIDYRTLQNPRNCPHAFFQLLLSHGNHCHTYNIIN